VKKNVGVPGDLIVKGEGGLCKVAAKRAIGLGRLGRKKQPVKNGEASGRANENE